MAIHFRVLSLRTGELDDIEIGYGVMRPVLMRQKQNAMSGARLFCVSLSLFVSTSVHRIHL